MIGFICLKVPLATAWRTDLRSKVVAGTASLETIATVHMRDDGSKNLGGATELGRSHRIPGKFAGGISKKGYREVSIIPFHLPPSENTLRCGQRAHAH